MVFTEFRCKHINWFIPSREICSENLGRPIKLIKLYGIQTFRNYFISNANPDRRESC